MPAEMPEFRTVAMPREQYLRREETRIRDAALPIHNSDPTVALHVDIIFKVEEIIEMHEVAESVHRQAGRAAKADLHRQFCADAAQIKFYHLDRLSHLVI